MLEGGLLLHFLITPMTETVVEFLIILVNLVFDSEYMASITTKNQSISSPL